eukprot:380501-Pelagomonas_calceolata.AAC.1
MMGTKESVSKVSAPVVLALWVVVQRRGQCVAPTKQKQRRPPVKTTDCWPAHEKKEVCTEKDAVCCYFDSMKVNTWHIRKKDYACQVWPRALRKGHLSTKAGPYKGYKGYKGKKASVKTFDC